MAKQEKTVDEFMSELRHPRKDEIEAVRSLILGSNKKLTEHVKWNAPSFCFNGEDRVTLRLQPKDRLELIFHRGAKVKDASGFVFKDSSGFMEWPTADRAVVTIRDSLDLKAKKAALVKIVNDWIKSTT